MQSLATLTAEMRALGIRSLTIELERTDQAPETLTDPAPPLDSTEPEPRNEKPLSQCAMHGCHQPRGGIFGAATEYCERHALEAAGVK